MRINVTGQGAAGGGGSGSLDPPPQVPIDEIFEVQFLRALANNVKPFEDVAIEWSINPLQPTTFPFADFIFTITANGNVLVADIAETGTFRFALHRPTLIHMSVRGRGTADSFTVGPELILRMDQSECVTVTIQAEIVNAQVKSFAQVATDTTALRLRRGPASSRREVEPTWRVGVIEYYFPLEVVINNFFNADLDVTIEVRFALHHQNDNTDLEVVITHESRVDFDTIEDIFSLGSSSAAARTANRLIPLILECELPSTERAFLRQILRYIEALGPSLDTHRMLDIRIVPTENFSHIAIVLCPLPQPPVRDDPVVVG